MSRTFCPALGGRPRLGAHRALATLNEVIAGGMTGWVLEADPKNFFGSLDHDWVLRFVEHRVGDPRLIGMLGLLAARMSTLGVWEERAYQNGSRPQRGNDLRERRPCLYK